MSELDRFKGNILTSEEKKYRMKMLRKTIADDNFDMAIDRELVPYLKKINSFPFVVTTQSCLGHGGDNGRKAHFDFRSMLSERETINRLLRPMYVACGEKISVELMLECDRLRYCLWLDNKLWKKQFEHFISLLKGINEESFKVSVDKQFFFTMQQYQHNEELFSLEGFTRPVAQKVLAVARLTPWDAYHLFRLAKNIPNKGTYVELGGFIGGSLMCAWQATKLSKTKVKFTMIDSFTQKLYGGKKGETAESKYHEITRLIPHRLIKSSSNDAKDKIKNNSVDLLFVDGGHSYAQVQLDLKNYWPKVKRNGLLLGHDYKADRPGVIKASKKVFGERIVLLSNSSMWLVRKEG